MKAKWQRVEVRIPKDLKASEIANLADLYIEAVKQRSERGISKDGKKFPKYSKEYIKSLDFKNAHKSADEINLTLSGDMLASIKILKKEKGKIVIGFEKGTEENAKADGNIRGTYGTGSENPKKARDFLGLPDRELQKLLDEFDSKELGRVSKERFRTVYF